MKRALKWIGIVLGALIGLIVIVVVGLAIYANLSFKRSLADRTLYPITADTSPEGLARGEYLMEDAMACTDACHTPENGPVLSGFYEEIQEGPISGRIAFPNLTPDVETGIGSWKDAEIARAIREGVDKNGVALVLMPAYNYNALSDADVAAIVGYLRSLDPVKNEIPPFELGLVAKIMLALGAFGQNPVQEPITRAKVAPEVGGVAYGEYLVGLGACRDCHQPNLAGGSIPFSDPGTVPAANLTPGGELVGWTAEDFIKAVQEGVKPSGAALSEAMPRYGTSAEDLAAIFAYLQTLPALPMNQ